MAASIDPEMVEAMCTSKRAYRSPEAAGRAASKAHANGSTDKLRVYPCPLCQQFHLTKSEEWTPRNDL